MSACIRYTKPWVPSQYYKNILYIEDIVCAWTPLPVSFCVCVYLWHITCHRDTGKVIKYLPVKWLRVLMLSKSTLLLLSPELQSPFFLLALSVAERAMRSSVLSVGLTISLLGSARLGASWKAMCAHSLSPYNLDKPILPSLYNFSFSFFVTWKIFLLKRFLCARPHWGFAWRSFSNYLMFN